MAAKGVTDSLPVPRFASRLFFFLNFFFLGHGDGAPCKVGMIMDRYGYCPLSGSKVCGVPYHTALR